nr:MAG TPA: minor capsid component [Caudoviricetes sp.]
MANVSVELPPWEIIAEPVAPDAAIEFWKQRAKLTDEEARALGEGAKRRAFYVTGLARRDLVQLVSDGIEEALKNGETLTDFKKRIATAIQTQGWHDYRVENIFRTNMQTAYSAGRYKKMQAVKASRPYWQYIAVMDKRVRPSHAILHEKVYPADHEFWATNYPPNGFRCRCGVRTLSARQVEKQGLTVETEMPRADMWTDPRTGYEYFVHFPGADKGFRNNPGKDWLDGLDLKKYPDLNKKSYEEQRGPDLKVADDVEKALGVRKGQPIEYKKAAEKANPKFQMDREYQINCQRCVPVYELRRRGYPVMAMPRRNQYDGKANACLYGYECFESPQVKGVWGRQPILNKADLLKDLKDLPDGARVGIIWAWPGKNTGGHTTVCEKVNGKLVFMDPQTGKIGDETLGKAHRSFGYSWYRMDDRNLNQHMDWTQVASKE